MTSHRPRIVLELAFLLCGCAAHQQPPAPTAAILFDDLGNHHHQITTTSPETQRYFDQGLRLIYGFNHEEAIRAFEAGVQHDPSCAMCYWGIGFALGPNYNLPLDDQRNQRAYEATRKAISLSSRVSACERRYIDALTERYSLDPKSDRKALDRAFADAMRKVMRACPDDLDAATIFAESLMDLRPWDLWTADGKPQPGTSEIVTTLERVLQRQPEHPGANHYYIHAIEASPQPEKGIASAQRLATLVPGAGHLVHMPSHIYIRTGRYAEASEANRQAIAADRRYLERAQPQGVYPMMYYPHNIHFLSAAASMEGRRAEAVQAARELVAELPVEHVRHMPMLEMFTPTLLFAYARFGMWDELLAEDAPPDDLLYTKGMWHYARSLAFSARRDLEQSKREHEQLQTIASKVPDDRIIGDNVPARDCLRLAIESSAAAIALQEGRKSAAIEHYEAAVELQDNLPYTEPPPWYYPVRESLGAALLSAKFYKDAEKVFREDLKRNPDNPRSLHGLAQSLRGQKRVREAVVTEERFQKAWSRADVPI